MFLRNLYKYFKINIFLKSIYFFIIFFLFIYEKVIRKRIRFYIVRSERIGHFIIEAELYFSDNNKHFTDLFYYNKPYSNDFLLNNYLLFKKNIYIVKWLYQIIFYFDKKSKYLVPNYNHSGNKKFYKSKTLINFNDKKLEQILINKGIDYNKLICFFQRDEVYSKSNPELLGHNKNEIRNTDPKIYIKTVKHFIDQGYTVVRTGPKISNSKLIVDNKYFEISEFYDPELEIFLFKKCKFVIGSNSGALSIGWAFKKYIANSNSVTLLGNIPGFNKMSLMPKIIKNIEKDKLLNLDDILKVEILYDKKFQFFDNSQDLILSQAIEIENLFLYNNYSDEQKKINNEVEKVFIRNNVLLPHYFISESFINKYPHFL